MNINDILTEAVANKASDIHITVGVPVMIRLRGELKNINVNKKVSQLLEK